MTSDCSFLLVDATSNEIWLKEDATSIFDLEIWNNSSFFIGLLFVIVLIMGCAFCNTYGFKQHDTAQKQIKQESLSSVSQKQIIPYLTEYCKHDRNIMNIIFEFSDVKIYEIIIKSTTTKLFLLQKLIISILIGTLLIFSYFSMYCLSAHLNDTYKSYIEIECIAYPTKECSKTTGPNSSPRDYDCGFVWELNLDSICADNVDQYTFSTVFEAQKDADGADDRACFINKDNFKVRGGAKCGCIGQCGNIGSTDNKGSCVCHNCCGYFFCAIFAVGCFLLYFTLLVSMGMDHGYEYKISVEPTDLV